MAKKKMKKPNYVPLTPQQIEEIKLSYSMGDEYDGPTLVQRNRIRDLAERYNKAPSVISTLLNNKDSYKKNTQPPVKTYYFKSGFPPTERQIEAIRAQTKEGTDISVLAEKFFFSTCTIKKIINRVSPYEGDIRWHKKRHLSVDEVKYIRKNLEKQSDEVLAERFAVSPGVIRDLRDGRTYANKK